MSANCYANKLYNRLTEMCKIYLENLHLEKIVIPKSKLNGIVKISDTEPTIIWPNSEYVYTYIIPVVILISMFVLAILVACLLHKKRKKLEKTKKLCSCQPEDFKDIPPRAPVILQYELNDENEIGKNKQPTLFKNEDLLSGPKQVKSFKWEKRYAQKFEFLI